jgi:hypothetical protein
MAGVLREVEMSDLLGDTSTALYSTLNGGTVLTAALGGTARIYDMQAPDGVSPPFLVFQHQGGGPDNITSAGIESNVWVVKVYSAVGAKAASDAFALADALLHRRNIAIVSDGGTINTWWCAREENIKLLENLPNGKRVWMRGGIYRIRTSN